MTPEETRARLLYRDGLMLVLDKPAGVAVHRGPKGGASLEDDFDALRFGLPRKPGARASARPRHRGLPGARTASQGAGETWASCSSRARSARPIGRSSPARRRARRALIDLPLGRLDDKRGWWMKVDPERPTGADALARHGRGDWRGAPIAWLELEPKTGRTHQLRVHCASQGWPILGDPIYGERADLPLQLLARKVVVPLVEVEAADRGRGARPAAHAGGARGVRLCGRSAPPL